MVKFSGCSVFFTLALQRYRSAASNPSSSMSCLLPAGKYDNDDNKRACLFSLHVGLRLPELIPVLTQRSRSDMVTTSATIRSAPILGAVFRREARMQQCGIVSVDGA